MLLIASYCWGQVSYRVSIDTDRQTYRVYMTSTTSYIGTNARISTAQVTLLVPHGTGPNQFQVSDLEGRMVGSQRMGWQLNARVNAPTENSNTDYLSFGFNNSSSPVLFDIPANQELALFSFKRTGPCLGVVQLFDNNSDPFRVPNSQSTNPGNQITIFGKRGDTYTGNYGGNASCAVQNPDLVATISGPSTLTVGMAASYTMLVQNIGNLTSGNSLTVSVGVPEVFTVNTINGSGWQCATVSESNGYRLHCVNTTPVVPGGYSSPLLLSVGSSGPPTTTLISGNVIGINEPATNNSFSKQVTIVSNPAVVEITPKGSFSCAGSAGSLVVGNYTLDNTSTYPSLTATKLAIYLPPTVSYRQASGSNWVCASPVPVGTNTVVSCTYTVGINGQTASTPLSVTLLQAVTGVSTLTATSTNSAKTNTVQTVLNLCDGARQADLSINATISNAAPQAGTTPVYTLRLSNAGPSSATGVQVKVTLPEGISLLSTTVTQGSFDIRTSIWSLAGIVSTTAVPVLSLALSVRADGPKTIEAEVIASSQPDPDSAPANRAVDEDDYSTLCVSVPLTICQGEYIRVSVNAATLPGEWIKDNTPLGITAKELLISTPGVYYYKVNPISGSREPLVCPTIVTQASTCCDPSLCIPITVRKSRIGS